MHQSLGDHIPGQAAIHELLSQRQRDAPVSLLGRIFGANPLSTETRPWFQGALGEVAVGKILSSLGPEWTVLHAVPVGVGSSDIDHVVIGPGGVYTINTKNHTGQPVWVAGRTLMVAGQRKRHIPNAEFEAQRAAKLLSAATDRPVGVTGLVVVVSPKTLVIRERPSNVVVLSDRQLSSWLRRRRAVLSGEDVQGITAAAINSRTWHRNAPVLGDPAELGARFEELRRQVNRAALRRLGWVLGFLAAVVAGLLFPALLR